MCISWASSQRGEGLGTEGQVGGQLCAIISCLALRAGIGKAVLCKCVSSHFAMVTKILERGHPCDSDMLNATIPTCPPLWVMLGKWAIMLPHPIRLVVCEFIIQEKINEASTLIETKALFHLLLFII